MLFRATSSVFTYWLLVRNKGVSSLHDPSLILSIIPYYPPVSLGLDSEFRNRKRNGQVECHVSLEESLCTALASDYLFM